MHALLASAYVWTQIVVPGATVSTAFGLNDKGQTAVFTTDGTAGIYRDGTFTPLPAPPPGYQVGPTGINDSGVVVGQATTTANPHEQGFILVGSVYKFFSRPAWQNTEPRAIGNSGLVTGTSFQDPAPDGSFASAGFIYDPGTGVFTDATPPGSTDTFAQGINKYGRISGHGRQPGLGPGRYAFVWQQGTIAEDERELLPFLPNRGPTGIGRAGEPHRRFVACACARDGPPTPQARRGKRASRPEQPQMGLAPVQTCPTALSPPASSSS